MNLTRRYLLLWLTACALRVAADRVVVDGQARRVGEVTAVDATHVVTSSGRFPRESVSRIEFQRFEVPRARFGLVLLDGTRLSGGLLERGSEQLRFYSVTAGLLEVPMTELAGIFYEFREDWLDVEEAFPGVVTRGGEVVAARRVLWADQESVAILTEQGMRRFPANTVSRVWWSRPADGELLRLRNGDVVNGKTRFQGTTVRFALLGQEKNLDWAALKQIQFSKPSE